MPVLSVIMREGRGDGTQARGLEPVQGHPALPPQGARALPVGTMRSDACRRRSRPMRGRHPEQVAVVRLLLLTGCRKGEILTLRWSDYRVGRLFLPDSKTGPNFLQRPVVSSQCHAMPN